MNRRALRVVSPDSLQPTPFALHLGRERANAAAAFSRKFAAASETPSGRRAPRSLVYATLMPPYGTGMRIDDRYVGIMHDTRCVATRRLLASGGVRRASASVLGLKPRAGCRAAVDERSTRGQSARRQGSRTQRATYSSLIDRWAGRRASAPASPRVFTLPARRRFHTRRVRPPTPSACS